MIAQGANENTCDPYDMLETLLGTNEFWSRCRLTCNTCGIVFPPPPAPPSPLPPTPPPAQPGSPPAPPSTPPPPTPPSPPLGPDMIFVSTTAEMLSHVRQAQQVAMVDTKTTSDVKPPAPPPPPNAPSSGLALTGPPPEVHLFLAPGTYRLDGYGPKPSRVADAPGSTPSTRATNYEPYSDLHVPILVNGFTLRLSSHGAGATLDAARLSRHFELFEGRYSYDVDAGKGDGSLVTVFTNPGGNLILDNVHLVNGLADTRQPTSAYSNGGAPDVVTGLSIEGGSLGGGCVLVHGGSLQVSNGRISHCEATNALLAPLESCIGVCPAYLAPRGGAIDVVSGTVTLTDVEVSEALLNMSGREDGRGGVINVRPGSSLSLLRSRIDCQGFDHVSPSADQVDASLGGAIAAEGAIVAVRASTITGCRAETGGAFYTLRTAAQMSGSLAISDSHIVNHAAQCLYQDMTSLGAVCDGNGGYGGCIAASGATIDIISSVLDRCEAHEGYGGVLYATSLSSVSITASNVTAARVTASPGAFSILQTDIGKGGLATLRASSLSLRSTSVTDVHAESGDNLLSFLAPESTNVMSGRRLTGAAASLDQSEFQASDLSVAHECSSTSPDAATLLGEGSRAMATQSNYRVSGMRGLSANFSGPCDPATLVTSLTSLVTVGSGSTGPSLCVNASQTCDGGTILNADGTTSPVCASGATCTCVPVVPAIPGVDAASLPASPQCACGDGSSPATVSGMPPALVPYEAPGVGCETPVRVASLLYASDEMVVSLEKPGVAQINATLSLGGTALREAVTWSVLGANGSLPSWLEAAAPSGVASKPTTEATSFDVPLRLDSTGLREGGTPRQHLLRVRVGLGLDEVASIPIRLYVTAPPVAETCTIERTQGDAAAQGNQTSLTRASTVLGAPFAFVMVSRDRDGLELSHEVCCQSLMPADPTAPEAHSPAARPSSLATKLGCAVVIILVWQVAGWEVSASRDGTPVPAANINLRLQYSGGGRYDGRVAPTLRGQYVLRLSYEGVLFDDAAAFTLDVGCPEGTAPLADGLCECNRGLRPNPDAATLGQPACIACTAGTYKDAVGNVGCMQCFARASSAAGATSRADCACVDGHFRWHNASATRLSDVWLTSLECRACGNEATCVEGATPATLNLTVGHWRVSPSSLELVRCLDEASCLGGVNTSSYCREGHTGPLCAVCEQGFTRSGGGGCEECAGGQVGRLDVATLLPLLVTLGIFGPMLFTCCVLACRCPNRLPCLRNGGKGQRGYRERPKARAQRIIASTVTKLKIMAAHQQVLQALSGVFQISWPPALTQLLRQFRVVNFDITDLIPFGCLPPYGYNFLPALVVRTLTPFGLVGALLLGARLAHRRGVEGLSYLLFNGGVLVVFLVYPSVTQTVFAFFQTTTFDEGLGTYLTADLSVNVDSTAYISMRPYAIAMVAVWPFGVPLVISILLWRSRAALLEIRRRERVLGIEASYDADKWTLYVEEQRSLGFPPDARDQSDVSVEGYLWSLTEAYRASVFYFEVSARHKYRRSHIPPIFRAHLHMIPPPSHRMIMPACALSTLRAARQVLEYAMQKLLLVGVLVFFDRGTLEQLIIGLVVCFSYFGAVMLLLPFNTKTDNLMACVTQVMPGSSCPS